MTDTNRFYNERFTATIGSQGRSRAMNAEFERLQQALDLVQAELDGLTGVVGRKSTDLQDFPGTLIGQAGQVLRVNAAATAFEFVGAGTMPVKTISATAYTLADVDAGALLLVNSASSATVTVPAGVFSQGEGLVVCQYASGRVTFEAGVGVTIISSDNLLSTRTQGANVGLVCVGSNQFLLVGERNAPSLAYATVAGGNAFTGAQTVAISGLTDGATIATDAAISNHFLVTLAGNRTLANPTNLRDGGIYNWLVRQDATGSRTLSYGSKFKWPAGTAPTLTTTANALDLIVAQYIASLDVLICSITKDFR